MNAGSRKEGEMEKGSMAHLCGKGAVPACAVSFFLSVRTFSTIASFNSTEKYSKKRNM